MYFTIYRNTLLRGNGTHTVTMLTVIKLYYLQLKIMESTVIRSRALAFDKETLVIRIGNKREVKWLPNTLCTQRCEKLR